MKGYRRWLALRKVGVGVGAGAGVGVGVDVSVSLSLSLSASKCVCVCLLLFFYMYIDMAEALGALIQIPKSKGSHHKDTQKDPNLYKQPYT